MTFSKGTVVRIESTSYYHLKSWKYFMKYYILYILYSRLYSVSWNEIDGKQQIFIWIFFPVSVQELPELETKPKFTLILKNLKLLKFFCENLFQILEKFYNILILLYVTCSILLVENCNCKFWFQELEFKQIHTK